MGFFSWNCKACGHPMLSIGACESGNEWMSEVVAILARGATNEWGDEYWSGSDESPSHSVLMGEYDGYGRVDDNDIDGDAAWYHRACWKACQKPTNMNESKAYGITNGPSESASDQGWFFNDGEHMMEIPGDFTFSGGVFIKYLNGKHAMLNPNG